MRKLLVAVMTATLMALAAPAFAGPGGTSETTTNEVNCNSSTPTGQGANVPGTGIYIGADGSQTAPQNGGSLVLCNEGGGSAPSPIQGRVIAKGGTGGGYVAADGDEDNPTEAEGWARLDVDTTPTNNVRCGGADGGGYNADAPTSTATNCDPR